MPQRVRLAAAASVHQVARLAAAQHCLTPPLALARGTLEVASGLARHSPSHPAMATAQAVSDVLAQRAAQASSADGLVRRAAPAPLVVAAAAMATHRAWALAATAWLPAQSWAASAASAAADWCMGI